MTLTDTGPLVALLDVADPAHEKCRRAAQSLPPVPLLTTWPCFTEAMYLLGGVGSHRYQATLWRLQATGRVVLHDMEARELRRAEELMATYANVPMDLADASLVAAAERLSRRSIFTLDRDFYVYRMLDGAAFDVVPGA